MVASLSATAVFGFKPVEEQIKTNLVRSKHDLSLKRFDENKKFLTHYLLFLIGTLQGNMINHHHHQLPPRIQVA